MKKIFYSLILIPLLVIPHMSLAGTLVDDGYTSAGGLQVFIVAVLSFLNSVIVPAILALGFVFFVWGMFQFFIAGGSNDESKEKGRSLMIYATLGFVIIVIFWGVINLLASSIGLENGEIDPPTIIVPEATE